MVKEFRSIVAFATAALLVLSACAPAAAPAPASAPAAPAQPKQPAPAAAPLPAAAPAPAPAAPAPAPRSAQEGPRYGGTLSFAHGSPVFSHMEPISQGTGMPHAVINQVYSRLVQPDWDKSPNEPFLAPELAEKWEVSKDGLSITFHLRKNAKWQNVPPVNGREVTSADVKYALERVAYDPTSIFQVTYRNVDKFETPDKYTFVIKMKGFDADLLPLLSFNHGWITPKEAVDTWGNLKTNAVGSGPFILEKWIKDVGVFYRKNPDYYIKGQPYVDKFEMLIIGDPQTRLTAFRTGQTCCYQVEKEGFESIRKTNPDVVYTTMTRTSTRFIGMQYSNPIFKDKRVREALSIALDRQAAINISIDGAGQWRGPISGQHADYALSQDELKQLMPYDLEKAKRLIQEAGYKDGLTLLMLHNGSYPQDYQSLTQYVIEQYKKIGITVKLQTFPHPIFRAKQDAGEFKDLIIGPDGQGTALAHLVQNYRTGGNKNAMGLSDPKLDAWIDEIASTVDEQERIKKAKEIQRFLLKEVYWKMNFMDVYLWNMNHPWVRGYKEAPPLSSINNVNPWAMWISK